MKRIYKLFIVLFVCAFAVSLVSCDKKNKNQEPEHVHAFTIKNTDDKYLGSEATCTQPAKYYFSCSCGEKGTEMFENGSALPHTYDKKVVDDKYLAAAATCTEAKKYYYSCSCGAKGEATFASGEALGHTPILDPESKYLASPATCTEKAQYHYICETCGEKLEETYPVGQPLDHTYNKLILSDATLAAAATCTEPAKYYYSCTCGAIGTTEVEVGYPLGHVFEGEWSVAVEPTEEAAGKLSRTCQREDCTEVQEFELPKLSADDYILSVTDPTCLVAGNKAYKYNYAGQSFTFDVVIAALEHDLVHVDAKEPTCLEVGWDAYDYCSRGDYTTYNEIPALGHHYTEEVAEEQYLFAAATCTEPAKYYYSCSCGVCESDSEHIFEYGDPLNHHIDQITGRCDRCDNISISIGITLNATSPNSYNMKRYPETNMPSDPTDPLVSQFVFAPGDSKWYTLTVNANVEGGTLFLVYGATKFKVYNSEKVEIKPTFSKDLNYSDHLESKNVEVYGYFYEGIENGTYYIVAKNEYSEELSNEVLYYCYTPFSGLTEVKRPSVAASCETIYANHFIYDGYTEGDYVLRSTYSTYISNLTALKPIEKSSIAEGGEHTYAYLPAEDLYFDTLTRQECYICSICGKYFDLDKNEVELESLYMGDFFMRVYSSWAEFGRGYYASGQVLSNKVGFDVKYNDGTNPQSYQGKKFSILFDDGTIYTPEYSSANCNGAFADEAHPEQLVLNLGRMVDANGYRNPDGSWYKDFSHNIYHVIGVFLNPHEHVYNNVKCECGKLIDHLHPIINFGNYLYSSERLNLFHDPNSDYHKFVVSLDLASLYRALPDYELCAIKVELRFNSGPGCYDIIEYLSDEARAIYENIEEVGIYFEDGSATGIEYDGYFGYYLENIYYPGPHDYLIFEYNIPSSIMSTIDLSHDITVVVSYDELI